MRRTHRDWWVLKSSINNRLPIKNDRRAHRFSVETRWVIQESIDNVLDKKDKNYCYFYYSICFSIQSTELNEAIIAQKRSQSAINLFIYNRKLFIGMKKMTKDANMNYPTHGDVSTHRSNELNEKLITYYMRTTYNYRKHCSFDASPINPAMFAKCCLVWKDMI